MVIDHDDMSRDRRRGRPFWMDYWDADVIFASVFILSCRRPLLSFLGIKKRLDGQAKIGRAKGLVGSERTWCT